MIPLRIDKKTVINTPEEGDPLSVWIPFFKSLKKVMGKEQAKIAWLMVWKYNGPFTSDPAFLKWAEKHGLDIANAGAKALAGMQKLGGSIVGGITTASKVMQVSLIVVPSIVAIVVLYALIKFINNPEQFEKLAKTGASLTPMGRAANIATA